MANEIALAQSDFSLNEEHRKLVVQNLTELRDSVWETMSLNTRKAYQSDFNQYLKFCRAHALPALASDWKITKIACQAFFDELMASELKHHTIVAHYPALRLRYL